MIAIAKEMISGFRYLFPRGKFRIVLIALSLLAATISVSELLVMKFFATLVLNEEEFTREFLGWAIAGFFLFFILTRVSQYFQRSYRVKAFARSFRAAKKDRTAKEENREWAMAFELSNILSFATQLVAIITFFFFLDPLLALINTLILIVVLQALGWIFNKQIMVQRDLVIKNQKKRIKPEKRYSARIKAGESGALISSAGTLVLLASLLYLSVDSQISPTNALIVFLGARLQNSVISNTSRSLMRYAKSSARIDSDDDFE